MITYHSICVLTPVHNCAQPQTSKSNIDYNSWPCFALSVAKRVLLRLDSRLSQLSCTVGLAPPNEAGRPAPARFLVWPANARGRGAWREVVFAKDERAGITNHDSRPGGTALFVTRLPRRTRKMRKWVRNPSYVVKKIAPRHCFLGQK